jgi:peptidoglycan/LPS O-acetylase OafA/YrhL
MAADGRLARLDGIRAIAIILVVLHHAGWLSIGWAGVDLFFVLSGYLITQILLRSRDSSDYWTSFYQKRTRRILPPLVPVLILGILFTPNIGAWNSLGYIFFLGNLVVANIVNEPLLGVTWSLAVEEHFYVIWPYLVKKCSRQMMFRVCIVLLAAEPVLRAIASSHMSGKAIYVLTPFRLDGLAAGSLLALLSSNLKTLTVLKRVSPWLTFAAMAVYGVLAVSLRSTFRHLTQDMLYNSVGYSLLALIAFGAVTYTLLYEQSIVCKFLSLRPMAELGKMSYGLYLYHMFAFVIAGKLLHTQSHSKIALLAIPMALVASWASYQYYEKPIMRKFTTAQPTIIAVPDLAPMSQVGAS